MKFTLRPRFLIVHGQGTSSTTMFGKLSRATVLLVKTKNKGKKPTTLIHSEKESSFSNIFPLLKLKTNISQSKNFLMYKVCSKLHQPHSRKIWPISYPNFFSAPLYTTDDINCVKSKLCMYVVVITKLLTQTSMSWHKFAIFTTCVEIF
jgi:hypothetical protein